MPPKSSNKKKGSLPNTLWFHCVKCGIHIINKERESHDKLCPYEEDTEKPPFDYIRNNIFYTMTFKKKDFEVVELQHMPARLLNNIIFMSDGVFRLMNIRIGDHVVVEPVNAANEGETVVRAVWPLSDKFLTTVLVSAQDFETNWTCFKSRVLKIEPVTNHVLLPAKSIIFELPSLDIDDETKNFDKNQLSDLQKSIKQDLMSFTFAKGNLINFVFYNKEILLKVKDVKSFQESEVNTSPEEDLENAVKALSLENKKEFFFIALATKIEVMNPKPSKEESQNENAFIDSQTKKDVGGLKKELEIVEDAMLLATGFKKKPLGVKISRGILLYGPSGCGKTLICNVMANHFKKLKPENLDNILLINSSDIYSKFLGESEKNLRSYFEKAYAKYPMPVLIIIEDIQNLCPKNESNDLLRRLNASFFSILDEMSNKTEGQKTFIIATSSDITNLNPGLRRSGRFDCEVCIGAPSAKDRESILKCLLSKLEHNLTAAEISELALVTHGFVGADLAFLVSSASLANLKNSSTEEPILDYSSMNLALNKVKPSAMREILIQCPSVGWQDIGGNQSTKLKLQQTIEWPLLYPERFKYFGIKVPKGILMYGPPGCSKTMFAKALATESKLNFISIKGPEIFSMWVGESEKAIREIFNKARQVAPAIVFFDEIDAIASERSEGGNAGSGSSVKERVLTQLLTELDGVQSLEDVVIVAATNRPDMIDKALLRPGRFDRLIYVGLPDAECREEIFKLKLKNIPLAKDVQINELVRRTEGYTGAEIQAVCHEASLKTLEESFQASEIDWSKFEFALGVIKPRTSKDLLQLYEKYEKNK